MVQIQDKIVSLDIFQQCFTCDLSQCEGFCCVHGESGAPLEETETAILEEILPVVRPFLQKSAQKVIDKTGAWVIDNENEKVTPLNNGKECIYAFFEEKVCKCAIEKAYEEGLTDFIKPISCHLYPIRISKFQNFEALNYHSWHVCKAARQLGCKLEVKVFRFLKEPIIRKYGEDFFNEMVEVEKNLNNISIS